MSLQLARVHGLRAVDVCQGVVAVAGMHKLAFFTGCVAVVQDFDTQQQRFYTVHTSEITCIGAHATLPLLATGQAGPAGAVHVWDAQDCVCVSRLGGVHAAGVVLVAFAGPKHEFVVSVGLEAEDGAVALWDWKPRTLVRATRERARERERESQRNN